LFGSLKIVIKISVSIKSEAGIILTIFLAKYQSFFL